MANNNKKGAIVGYSTAALTAGALGVALYVAGDKSLDLTDGQKASLTAALGGLEINEAEIIDSKGNVVAQFTDTNTLTWKWQKQNSDNTITEVDYTISNNQIEYKELKDANGNVIGVYQAPDGEAKGKLYLNGKWYDDVVDGDDGKLKSGEVDLGTYKDGKFTYQVDGKEVSATVGTEHIRYNAITNTDGEIVGYQEVANTFPKKTFFFDNDGFNSNGILTARDSVTQAKEKLLGAVEGLKGGDNPIDEKALKEYINIIKGIDIKDYNSVAKYTEAVQQTVEKEGTLLNKLSAGANEVASSEIFDKVNNYLGSGIADPSSIGVISLCAVGAIAVGGITALATKAITGTDKKKVFGATSLNSSHKNINKTR